MCLHDRIVNELVRTKSLAAFIYLLEKGREIEFSFHGETYFVSRSESQQYISLWNKRKEQSFETIEDLIERGLVSHSMLLSVWSEIQIETIF